MKSRTALYIHDHIFITDGVGRYYSEGKITDEVFSRYEVCAGEIFVLSRSRCGSVENLTQITNPRVSFFPLTGTAFTKIFTRFFVANFKRILFLTKKSDFVILRLPSFIAIACYPFIRLFKKPYFVECVGDPYESILTGHNKRLLIRVVALVCKSITKRMVWNAAGAIYVTKGALQEKFPTQGFTEYASNVELPGTAKLSPELKTLPPWTAGLIGSFNNDYKGLDIAIEAISLLKNRGLHVTLRILGSGNSTRFIELAHELKVESQVFFDGTRTGGEAVYQWLDELDIYIQPSRTEGLPRALIEAMSRGLPCIGTRVGGIPELLSDYWLVDANSAGQLADKMAELLTDPKKRKSACEENLNVAQQYTRSILTERRDAFWQRANMYLVKVPNTPSRR